MDTRSKIVEIAAGDTVVAGYFDPVAAMHAARLRELAGEHGPLTVCVCDPADPLLPANARAELVAALRDVARVVIGEKALNAFRTVVDERPGDLERRAALIRHVHARQNG
ncbi:MAG: hypothetical protein FJW30_22775 [Acidobacteria bacterium]|nr:hypothetical protein [Acidobacteriota bacterium]